MDIRLKFLKVSTFLELHYYTFGLLDPCREKDTDITHACFATHMLQNKELLSLKQWQWLYR